MSSLAGSCSDRWDLVWPHRDRLLAVARPRVACFADAEDYVTEAMLRAVEHENLDESRVGAFLCTVVMRLVVDGYRDSQRLERASRQLCARELAFVTFEDAVCEREEAQWLAGRLAGVRGRELQLVEARRAGHTVTEAAQSLGITTKAAENAWTRVRCKAHRILRD